MPDRSTEANSDAEKYDKAAEVRTETTPSPTHMQKILVVDDMPDAIAVLRSTLSPYYTVESAGNGVEAITKLRGGKYSMVISDVIMPGMDGFGLLAAIRKDPLLRDIPVLMVTVDNDQANDIKALDLGAIDVIHKPFVVAILLRRVHNLCRMRALAHEFALNHQKVERQKALLNAMEHDELTGLLNKQAFLRAVQNSISRRSGKRYMVVRWDIDDFSLINDRIGFTEADKLLREIGTMIAKEGRSSALYAHFEADHFAEFYEADSISPEKRLSFLQNRIDSLTRGFKANCRMGVYITDSSKLSAASMCDRALKALRSTKGSFSKRLAWYDSGMLTKMLEEQRLSDEMVPALEDGQFEVYYQPQVDYSKNELIGAEALVRWNHPERGVITPDGFLPLFERNGLISKLDLFVWEETCRQLREWINVCGSNVPPISVNVSRLDLYNDGLCSILSNLVEKYGIPTGMLHLEITESAYAFGQNTFADAITRLSEAGFRIAMDDFGSAYSSLNSLKEMNVDLLKLDMVFLKNSKESNFSRGSKILSSIVRMARWLSLPVIAEGVETKEQADFLKSIGCPYMQGFLFSKPVPAAAFEKIAASMHTGNRIFSSSKVHKPDAEERSYFTQDNIEDAAAQEAARETAALRTRLAEEERYRIIVEQAGISVIEWNHITGEFFSSNGYKKYALSNDDMSAVLDSDSDSPLVYPGDISPLRKFFADTSSGSDTAEAVIRLRMTDGTFRWTRMRGNYVRDNSGVPIRTIGTFQDVDDEMQAREQLAGSRARLSGIISNIPFGIGIYRLSREHTFTPLYISARASSIFGLEHAEYDVGTSRGNDDRGTAGITSVLKKMLAENNFMAVEGMRTLTKKADGVPFWLQIYAAPYSDKDNSTLFYVTMADVTNQVRNEEQARAADELYKLLLDNTETITYDYSTASGAMQLTYPHKYRGSVRMRKRVYADYTKYIGTSSSHIAGEWKAGCLVRLSEALARPQHGFYTFRAFDFRNNLHWYRTNYVSLPDKDGRVYRIVGQLSNFDSYMSEQKDILENATIDKTTGLNNKSYGESLIRKAMLSKTDKRCDAMFFMDIDNFKAINDTIGHVEADSILTATGRILRTVFRGSDIKVRFGGDEFIVYMQAAGDVTSALNVAERLLQKINSIKDYPCAIGFSIGIAMLNGSDVSFEDALKRADRALYSSKSHGKNRCTVYSNGM